MIGEVQAAKEASQLLCDRRAGGLVADRALMIGHSPWDARAAERAGVRTFAVMTGGFSREELREGGAVAVFESVANLRAALDRAILRGESSKV